MAAKWKWAVFLALVLACAVVLLAIPSNKYEWMLAEDPEMTRAALPHDANAGLYPFFAGIPAVLPLLFVFLFRTWREKGIAILLLASLFAFWLVRFWPNLAAGPPY